MITLGDLFAFAGRTARLPFALGIWGVAITFAAGIRGSEALLPWMATVLAPHGINAGFALNAIWAMLGLLLVWTLSALGARRMRDIGRSPWWAPAAVLSLGALALLNDTIFLLSRTNSLPRAVQWLVLTVAGGIGLWVLAEGLLRSSKP